jgi:protein phosphatase
MDITIPELALVVLIGAAGSGKSTFAQRRFPPTAVVSSDRCRAMISDDENDQSASAEAFALAHAIVGKRLSFGKLTVFDATNVHPDARKPLIALAKEHHCPAVAVVFDVPAELCTARDAARTHRTVGPEVIRLQHADLQRHKHTLHDEGFRFVFSLSTIEDMDHAVIYYQPSPVNRRFDAGPFDIIGDVHGCCDELEALLARLGYEFHSAPEAAFFGMDVRHPLGRRAVFLGDLVDRGPRTPDTLKLVMSMTRRGAALCVPGNHDIKLCRKLRGRETKIEHGLAQSLEQLAAEPAEFLDAVAAFFDSLPNHYILDGGRLVVAHAGMKRKFQGRTSSRVREFALYGETTGEYDVYGLPIRVNWASDYDGAAAVVYGHTPVPESEWINNTINVDNGCVFGGKLTALRYPEKTLVSVPAARIYYESPKPFPPAERHRVPAGAAKG